MPTLPIVPLFETIEDLQRAPAIMKELLAVPLVLTYLDTGLVPRLPTAILVTGLGIVAVLCFFAGLILDTVTRGRREVRRLAYLAQLAPGSTDRRSSRRSSRSSASRSRRPCSCSAPR